MDVRLGEHVGETVVTCGLVVEQRTYHQITGEPMKFLTLADWTGRVETELSAQTYKSYGLATVRYPVLEITATVEPVVSRNSKDVNFMQLHGNNSEADHRVVCDSTHYLQMETPEIPVG